MLEHFFEQINIYLRNHYYLKEAKIKLLSLRDSINPRESLKVLEEKYSEYNYYSKLQSFIVLCSNFNDIEIKGYTISYIDRKYAVLGLTIITTALTPLINKTRFRVRTCIPWFIFYSMLFCRENLNPYMTRNRD